jgi:hypothetical protein
MFLRVGKKGQSTLEYAILIGVVVAGLIAMQVYLKRGIQGGLRESADTAGKQFSPGHTTNEYTTTSTTSSKETVMGGVTRTEITDQQVEREGSEEVATQGNENWWPE